MIKTVCAGAGACLALALFCSDAALGQRAGQPPGAAAPLRLTLRDSVELALAPPGSAQVLLAEQRARQFRARQAQSLGALLPHLDSSVVDQNQTRNLAAFGIRVTLPAPGFQFPERVGPFGVFDARVTLSQSLLDLGALGRYQAARAAAGAAETEREHVEEVVTGQVARAYLAALRARDRVDAVGAAVALAEALARLAEDQKAAGTGIAVEVTRARVQLRGEQQRLLAAESELRQALYQLARWLGVSPETPLELVDRLGGAEDQGLEEARAVEEALQSRFDLRAQRRREESARLAYNAVRRERLPSLTGFADYGSIGSAPGSALPTRTVGVALKVPLYDGGRREARRAEGLAQWEQERIRTRDLELQVRTEVLVALEALRSAREQVRVADEVWSLSAQELEQARRRYQAGITTSIEVVDAQTRRERASDGRIAAFYGRHLALLTLGEAMGTLRSQVLRQGEVAP